MMVDWEGKPSIMHVFINTTELHQLEEAKNRIRCQKIMFASASHEFRTPLNSIMNSFDFIANSHQEVFNFIEGQTDKIEARRIRGLAKSKEAMQKFIRMGKSSSIFLLALVDDILNLSKMEAGTFQVNIVQFSLEEVIEEAYELFSYQCNQKGIELNMQVEETLKHAVIQSDRNRIRQIFLNLLSNAFKFTFVGSIVINACLKDNEGGKEIEVKVKDTGVGIEQSDLSKLFTLFSKVSENSLNPNGTGLGLTI
jgi:signal transduction histidine kinase